MFFSEFRFPYGMGERRKELGSKPGRRFTARKFREKRLIKRLASPVSHRSIIDDRHPHSRSAQVNAMMRVTRTLISIVRF
jgi:hypothetical protein